MDVAEERGISDVSWCSALHSQSHQRSHCRVVVLPIHTERHCRRSRHLQNVVSHIPAAQHFAPHLSLAAVSRRCHFRTPSLQTWRTSTTWTPFPLQNDPVSLPLTTQGPAMGLTKRIVDYLPRTRQRLVCHEERDLRVHRRRSNITPLLQIEVLNQMSLRLAYLSSHLH
jgi:hypothetical protein